MSTNEIYGHGGSGWSLSWGSAQVAMGWVLPHRPRHLAVIGAGAIGLTTARVAQRAGLRVHIYLNDRGHDLFVVPRRDGLLVATQETRDFGNADARIDWAVSEGAVERLGALFG
ncbi:MAG: hypothetical protein JOY60_14515 [Burkholderiaceae bacterium]|nr:hypothetical protein [Roseateles sp.]MBV8471061.1 hypothetical protein [Burkholderiaceae bacterium]